MSSDINTALELAATAHMNQVDEGGHPYIFHPLRVMMKFIGDEETMIIAILHDVVEDSDYTLADIRLHGFSEYILETLDLLTRKKGQSYAEYINGIVDHETANKVKLADLEDNMDLTRLPVVTEIDLVRISRYHLTRKALLDLKYLPE